MAASATQAFEFTVGEIPALVVRNPLGTVTIQPGASSQIAISATKHVTGLMLGGNGLDLLERVTVQTEQAGDTVSVSVKHPRQFFSTKAVTVDLVITVPDRTRLDVEVDAGNIELRGGSGVARAEVDAGNVRAEGFTFLGSSKVSVDAGNATLHAALESGGSLEVSVDAGNARLQLPRETAAYLEAAIDAGSLKVSGWQVETKNELVSHKARGALGPNASGTLRVRVDAGSITIVATE
jgi:hypothetical protein